MYSHVHVPCMPVVQYGGPSIGPGGGSWPKLGCCCLHSSWPPKTDSQMSIIIPPPAEPPVQHGGVGMGQLIGPDV